MNTNLFFNSDNEFDLVDLKALFAFKTESNISFLIGRWSNSLRLPGEEEKTVYTADRPFIFNAVGWLDVHHPCDAFIKTQIRIRIPVEYHAFDRIKVMIEAIFKALEIPLDETYEAKLFDGGKSTGVFQPVDRDGMANCI